MAIENSEKTFDFSFYLSMFYEDFPSSINYFQLERKLFPTSSLPQSLFRTVLSNSNFRNHAIKIHDKTPMEKNAQNTAQLLKRNREFGVSRTKGRGWNNFGLGVISLQNPKILDAINNIHDYSWIMNHLNVFGTISSAPIF